MSDWDHDLNTPPERCVVCGEPVEGLVVRESEGSTQYVDDKGSIQHSHLSPERAREIGELGRTRKKTERDAEAAELGQALVSVLVDDSDSRAPALRVLLGQLARAAAKDSSGSIRAVESALALVGQRARPMEPPGANEACPLCGRLERPLVLQVTPEGAAFLRSLVEKESDDVRAGESEGPE